jgi:hypothetical protein
MSSSDARAKATRTSSTPFVYAENCNMVYGDAAAVMTMMIEAVRGLGTKAAA